MYADALAAEMAAYHRQSTQQLRQELNEHEQQQQRAGGMPTAAQV